MKKEHFYFDSKEGILYIRHNGVKITVECDRSVFKDAEYVMEKLWDVCESARRAELFESLGTNFHAFSNDKLTDLQANSVSPVEQYATGRGANESLEAFNRRKGQG